MQATPHILIAENDIDLANLLADSIGRVFPLLAVVWAREGAEALIQHALRPAILIITDYRMFPVDGLTLVRTLREKNDRTPVILWTSEPMIHTAASRAGVTAVVPKTTGLMEICRLIGEAIEHADE